jgi:hypothetical protein
MQRFMQSAGQAFHGQSFRQWQHHCCLAFAISDADWLVHSLNRSLSATVLTVVVGHFCFVFPKCTLMDSTGIVVGRVTESAVLLSPR